MFKNVAKICAFGYCLTDEQFHILEKEDLLIDPQGNFHLTDRKGEQGIVLPYKYEDFKNYPTFSQRAEKIYGLLQDGDTLVVGHAVQNDVKYLNLESKRFSLPSFSFSFADTQFVYMNTVKEFSRQFGLGVIARELGVEFTPHRAVDDAYATMRIAEAMCKEEGVRLPELLKKYEISLGRIENYEVRQATSKASEAHAAAVVARKEAREKARAAFHTFLDRNRRRRDKNGAYKDKSVCFSRYVEENRSLCESLVLEAFALGFSYVYRVEECDYYIRYEGETGQRVAAAMSKGVCILTPDEFSEFLKTHQKSGV